MQVWRIPAWWQENESIGLLLFLRGTSLCENIMEGINIVAAASVHDDAWNCSDWIRPAFFFPPLWMTHRQHAAALFVFVCPVFVDRLQTFKWHIFDLILKINWCVSHSFRSKKADCKLALRLRLKTLQQLNDLLPLIQLLFIYIYQWCALMWLLCYIKDFPKWSWDVLKEQTQLISTVLGSIVSQECANYYFLIPQALCLVVYINPDIYRAAYLL